MKIAVKLLIFTMFAAVIGFVLFSIEYVSKVLDS